MSDIMQRHSIRSLSVKFWLVHQLLFFGNKICLCQDMCIYVSIRLNMRM